jgi:hypothetical protein
LSTGLTMVSQGAAVISGVPFLSSVAGPVHGQLRLQLRWLQLLAGPDPTMPPKP